MVLRFGCEADGREDARACPEAASFRPIVLFNILILASDKIAYLFRNENNMISLVADGDGTLKIS